MSRDRRVYLDWNASAPLRTTVRQAIGQALDLWGNPSSPHTEGRHAKAMVERARVKIADRCGCLPEHVVFTSGSTEAAALALEGRRLDSARIEHECVLVWTTGHLEVSEDGMVKVEDPSRTCLQVANGETGVVQGRSEGLAVTDATQAVGKMPIKNTLNQAEMAFISGHKIGGPKGVGALLLSDGAEITPRILGGGQESGRRSGTENVIGIVGFAAAVEEASQEFDAGRWETVRTIRDLLEDILLDSVPGLTVFGKQSPRLPNTSYFAALGWKSDLQLIDLDLSGFAVSAGSACSSGKLRSSGVLESMGVSSDWAECAIRVSLGPTTRREDIERFAETWVRKYKRHANRYRAGID